jgi:hypothetical protein
MLIHKAIQLAVLEQPAQFRIAVHATTIGCNFVPLMLGPAPGARRDLDRAFQNDRRENLSCRRTAH